MEGSGYPALWWQTLQWDEKMGVQTTLQTSALFVKNLQLSYIVPIVRKEQKQQQNRQGRGQVRQSSWWRYVLLPFLLYFCEGRHEDVKLFANCRDPSASTCAPRDWRIFLAWRDSSSVRLLTMYMSVGQRPRNDNRELRIDKTTQAARSS
jgi:hypothetical protein